MNVRTKNRLKKNTVLFLAITMLVSTSTYARTEWIQDLSEEYHISFQEEAEENVKDHSEAFATGLSLEYMLTDKMLITENVPPSYVESSNECFGYSKFWLNEKEGKQVENRLKAVSNKNDLLVAMAYDGDGNRIFQLNYNLHTDDDWKGKSGNGNGNNKDNSGSGNTGNSKTKEGEKKGGILSAIASFFTGGMEESEPQTQNADGSNKTNDNGNNGNNGNGGNGNHKGWENGNSGSDGTGNTGAGNTTNTGGSTNQSGILFPIEEEVSELEAELIGRIKTTGKEKNYELVEYVNDVNREYTEVLMELNINGIMDTAYSYGNERLTNERFTEWTGYYTYDIRGSVSGITDSNGMIWQSYRYNVNGEMTFGKPQYNNVYGYNAESYNPNMDTQYLRARYYSPETANFLTEDSYLGNIRDPLSLNRYNYVKSSLEFPQTVNGK